MAIKGIENLSNAQIDEELRKGAKFVVFQYCISVLVMSFKRSSDVHFVRAGESTLGKAAPWCLASLLVGWWGIPWGIFFTIQTSTPTEWAART